MRALIGDRAPTREVRGVIDTLGDDTVRRSTGQAVMESTLLPKIYEAVWRPLIFGAATAGITEAAEAKMMRRLLALQPGDRVLDLGCGPGNTTRRLVDAVGPGGLVVGLDAARGMLERAVADTPDEHVVYVRADAGRLPFDDGSFDAVAAFGMLYLADRPFDVIAELARVLAPGGRAAILTTCHRAPAALRPLIDLGRPLSGLRMFDPDEVIRALQAGGVMATHHEVRGFMQYIGGQAPEPTSPPQP